MAAFFRLSYFSYTAVAVLLAVFRSCLADPKIFEYDYERCGLDWKGNCSEGKSQSPINIVTQTTMGGAFPIRNFRLHYEKTSPVSLHHTAHVIEVQVKSRNNIMHTPFGPFQLRQFHFHAISEHAVDGFFGPLEVHFVHFDASGAKAAVFAVLFALSPEDTDNALLNRILSNLPKNTAETFNFTMGLKELLLPRGENNSYLSYYTYTGSLTTPPCSEIVTWYVRKRVSYISMKQLTAVVMVNRALGGDRFDNRLPVPLNCRKVASHQVV